MTDFFLFGAIGLVWALFWLINRFQLPHPVFLMAGVISVLSGTGYILFRYFPALGIGRGRPLKIFKVPKAVNLESLNRSSVRTGTPKQQAPINSDDVVFVHEHATALWIGPPDALDDNSALLHSGPLRPTPRASKIDLHIYFGIENFSAEMIRLYDIRAHVYHVSSGYLPAAIGYIPRYRVEMRQDNSILSEQRVYPIRPGNGLFVDLYFETSFFDDTLSTLIVFGLFCYYEVPYKEAVRRYRMPSTKIYVVQHWDDVFGKTPSPRVNVGALDGPELRQRAEEARKKFYFQPDRSPAQTDDVYRILESIEKMFIMHTSDGVVELQ